MSFDLAGLLQRNTQNTLSGLSSSALAGRTDMSSKTAEGAQAGSLTVGSAISGQVIKVEGDTVYVKLPSEVLTAKLQEGMNLQSGQSVTFAVSGISDKQITLHFFRTVRRHRYSERHWNRQELRRRRIRFPW